MMWGMTLHPGEEYSRAVSKEEHLTLASLDCRPTMNTDVYRTFAHLVVKVNNCEHVLCYLEKGIIHQQILNFILQKGDNLVLSVEGTGIVHISGYYVSHSRHEDIQQDGSMISAVNAVFGEMLDMDPTIPFQNQPETNGLNSTVQNNKLQDTCRPSERQFKQSSLGKQIKAQPKQNDVNQSVYRDVECGDIDGTVVCNNSEGAEHCKSAEGSSCLRIPNDSTVCLENSNFQETFAQLTYDCGNSKDDCNDHESQEATYTSKACLSTHEHESNQDMEISGADVDDTLHSGLCSENDEEENKPDPTDSHINMADDELPVSDSSHYETFSGANEEENYCQTSIERLKRSGVKTIEKSPDKSLELLLKCDAGKEQSHSTLTVGVPAKMESLTSLRSTQQPQQCRAAESAASESSITECEETPINRSQYKCTACEKTFCRQQRKTPMVSEMQMCQSCNILVRQKDASYKKETTKREYLQSHSLKKKSFSQCKKESRLKSGTIGKLFKCHLCKKKFSSKRCLNIHKTTHGDNQFLCQFCGEMFTRKQSFHIHERTHISNRPFECQFCPKTFVQKKEMILHEKKHQLIKRPLQSYMLQNKILKRKVSQQKRLKTKRRPFQCQFCGKRFTSKSHVVQHERIHTGERPFKCRHCAKAFRQKSHCTQHERIHTGEKRFKCDFCEKRFILKAYATNHERRCHPGESPFKCKFCSIRFTTKSQLTKHETVHIDK